MKNLLALAAAAFLVAFISEPVFAQNLVGQKAAAASPDQPILLPTGWQLSPVGRSLPLGDFPMNMAVSPSGKLLAVVNNGQGKHSLQLISTKKETILADLEVPTAWLGLVFEDEKSLWMSAGNENRAFKFAVERGSLRLVDSIVLAEKWAAKISLAGLEIDRTRRLLLAVTKESNTLHAFDLETKKEVFTQKLPAEAYTCRLAPDGRQLAISIWGGKKVVIFDLETRKISREIAVGSHPNELLFSKKGDLLFVANADDNSVSVIDFETKKIIETLDAALYPNAPTGSTTNGLALSKGEKRLFIANADNNCLAVFDLEQRGQSRSLGFIPVGWYPTSVKTVGRKIFVANGKGFSSFPNPDGPNPIRRETKSEFQKGEKRKEQYIGSLMVGSMSIFEEPTEAEMTVFSQKVYRNCHLDRQKAALAEGEPGNPIPRKTGEKSPIEHVFYIIKENRTYDQVLGDMPEGNGDASLCLFGENVTPNQHALAREFVLLDNFYVAAEVSADGHSWSTAAYANDFNEKTWIQSYGGRGGEYVFEGTAEIANPKGGFIWDHCLRAGVSFRTYGEFADDYKANYPTLEGHFCPYFTSWDESVRDTTRFSQWRREFDSLVVAGKLPQLSTLRLINDHTQGLRKGSPTPFAHVADNDLALGLLIEHLSKSPVWSKSAVFVLEDDAQNGADHVDAHRSIAFIASPWAKRGFRDTTLYTTNSMLRTIGLILGMPPMSQHDAAAIPMWRCFSKKMDAKGFATRPSNVNLDDRNVVVSPLSKQFDGFDFAGEDRVPDLLFNQLLWKAIRGEDSEMPAPRRAAWLQNLENEEEDDDD